MTDALNKIKDSINSNLPIVTLMEKFLNNDEKGGFSNIYNILLGIVQLFICIYTLYVIWKCLQIKDGSGNYVNGVCEFVLASCCLPCYLFWRTFISPCNLTPKTNIAPVSTSLEPVVTPISTY
jgi:hypothetical protein